MFRFKKYKSIIDFACWYLNFNCGNYYFVFSRELNRRFHCLMCAVYNALDCDMINAIKIQKTSLVQNYSFVVTSKSLVWYPKTCLYLPWANSHKVSTNHTEISMRFWAKSNARIFLQIQYFVGMFWHNDTLSYCAGCYTSTFTQNKLLCNSTYILTSTKYLIACFYKTSNVFIKPKNQVKNIKSNEMQEYWDFFLFFVLV